MKSIVSISIITGMFLTSCSSNGQVQSTPKDKNLIEISPNELIATFDSLDYFKLTPDNELDSLKNELKKSFINLQYFEGKQFYDSIKYVDHRFYWLDGEELYEEGGLIYYLDEVKPTFEKLGLTLEYANEQVEISDTNLKHTIELNGREYIAYTGEYNDLIWGYAAHNFALMLNEELKIQNSKERVYLISGGNDGRMVFLTEELYGFITSVYPKDEERPMEVGDWAKENGL